MDVSRILSRFSLESCEQTLLRRLHPRLVPRRLHVCPHMSLRAKRAALTAKVTANSGASGAPGEGTSANDAPPSPRPSPAAAAAGASSTAAVSPSSDAVAIQREKLDQIAATFVPTIVGGHQSKQPPSYIFEDTVRSPYYTFRMRVPSMYMFHAKFLQDLVFAGSGDVNERFSRKIASPRSMCHKLEPLRDVWMPIATPI